MHRLLKKSRSSRSAHLDNLPDELLRKTIVRLTPYDAIELGSASRRMKTLMFGSTNDRYWKQEGCRIVRLLGLTICKNWALNATFWGQYHRRADPGKWYHGDLKAKFRRDDLEFFVGGCACDPTVVPAYDLISSPKRCAWIQTLANRRAWES